MTHRRPASWLIAMFLAFSTLLTHANATTAANGNELAFTGGWYHLERVIDGDTIRVVELSRSVRLAGINAPETYESLGMRATDTLRWLLNQKQYPGWVYLEPAINSYDSSTDRYRADVWFYDVTWGGWVLTQAYQASRGLATVDRGHYASDYFLDYLLRMEAYAQRQNCGIWGGVYC